MKIKEWADNNLLLAAIHVLFWRWMGGGDTEYGGYGTKQIIKEVKKRKMCDRVDAYMDYISGAGPKPA